MITAGWLRAEIEHLKNLEGPAIIRLREAVHVAEKAKQAMKDAGDELESLEVCRKEWERQLSAMEEKQGKP